MGQSVPAGATLSGGEMTAYETELVIDFGEVGYRQARHPFKIRLKAEGLWELLKDAMASSRL